MMKVKFLTPVQHDKEVFQDGDTAEMTIKEAKALIEVGAAEEAGVKAKDEKPAADARKK